MMHSLTYKLTKMILICTFFLMILRARYLSFFSTVLVSNRINRWFYLSNSKFLSLTSSYLLLKQIIFVQKLYINIIIISWICHNVYLYLISIEKFNDCFVSCVVFRDFCCEDRRVFCCEDRRLFCTFCMIFCLAKLSIRGIFSSRGIVHPNLL